MANHLPSKTQKFLASAQGSPYLAVSALTTSVTSSRSPSAWNCATNRESVMNARSRATLPFTSASILATTSPASAWTRLFSIFVPVASANVLIELSSAAFAAVEYNFCDSTPIEEPFNDVAASSSSCGTSGCTLGVDFEGLSPHAARPAAPSTPTPIPRKPRRDHNGLSSMAIASFVSPYRCTPREPGGMLPLRLTPARPPTATEATSSTPRGERRPGCAGWSCANSSLETIRYLR